MTRASAELTSSEIISRKDIRVKNIVKKLLKLANELDRKGLRKEADALDSFVKEAGAVAAIGAWVTEQLDDTTVAEIADRMEPERIARVAKAMDKEKQKVIIKILAEDSEVRAVAFEALGIDPSLGNLGFEALKEMQGLGVDTRSLPPGITDSAGSAGELGGLAGLQEMFGKSLQKGDPVRE